MEWVFPLRPAGCPLARGTTRPRPVGGDTPWARLGGWSCPCTKASAMPTVGTSPSGSPLPACSPDPQGAPAATGPLCVPGRRPGPRPRPDRARLGALRAPRPPRRDALARGRRGGRDARGARLARHLAATDWLLCLRGHREPRPRLDPLVAGSSGPRSCGPSRTHPSRGAAFSRSRDAGRPRAPRGVRIPPPRLRGGALRAVRPLRALAPLSTKQGTASPAHGAAASRGPRASPRAALEQPARIRRIRCWHLRGTT